nr:hypothetical protein [uncultured Psychroserpens sp.]
MGGNLFKLGRISKAEYLKIEAKVSKYLDKKIGTNNYVIPRYYSDKEDFGDLDILINSSEIEDWQQLKLDIVADLNIQQHKSVGNVFSTVYDNFQVDYFTKSDTYFNSSYSFLCFNDVGNFIGRMVRRFNLKYGEKGLLYVYRRTNQDNYSKDIPITLDFEKIFTFLGLDYKVWEIGFASREVLFDWIIESPYFSTAPYLEENKAIQKRKQRTTVIAFIDYLKSNKIEKKPEFLERDDYLNTIHNYFPEANLLSEIEKEQKRKAYIEVIRNKYNGRIIMALFPELNGKELGSFMTQFQTKFENHETLIYESSSEEVVNLLITFKKEYDNRRS